jgi:RHS repeat-associated protein
VWVKQQGKDTSDKNYIKKIKPTNYKAPKNGYVYIYLSNQSNNDVYWDNFAAGITQGNIAEENHYYAYGLRIATLSSKKLGDTYEGSLKNNYLYQGAFAELDDDIGWTDFALRNYDAQIGRWVQQDPFDQFASPYVGMGADPVNLIDPSGGVVVPPGGGSVLSMTAETAKTMGEVIVKVGPGLGSAAAKAGSGLTTKLLSGTGRALAVNAINTGAKINTHIVTRAVSESTGQGRGVNRNLPSIKPKESEPFDLKKSAQIAAEKGPKLKALSEHDAFEMKLKREARERQAAKEKAILGATMDPVAGSIAYATLNTAKDYVDGIADHAVGVYDGMKGHDWWGAAKNGAFLFLDVAPLGVKGTGAIKGGENIALGVGEYLDDFARGVNGSTWKTWGAKDFQSQFLETINNPANKIYFNLDGVASPWSAISEGARGLGISRATSWELYQLYSNPAALQRTIFYQGGKIVPNPFH